MEPVVGAIETGNPAGALLTAIQIPVDTHLYVGHVPSQVCHLSHGVKKDGLSLVPKSLDWLNFYRGPYVAIACRHWSDVQQLLDVNLITVKMTSSVNHRNTIILRPLTLSIRNNRFYLGDERPGFEIGDSRCSDVPRDGRNPLGAPGSA